MSIGIWPIEETLWGTLTCSHCARLGRVYLGEHAADSAGGSFGGQYFLVRLETPLVRLETPPLRLGTPPIRLGAALEGNTYWLILYYTEFINCMLISNFAAVGIRCEENVCLGNNPLQLSPARLLTQPAQPRRVYMIKQVLAVANQFALPANIPGEYYSVPRSARPARA